MFHSLRGCDSVFEELAQRRGLNVGCIEFSIGGVELRAEIQLISCPNWKCILFLKRWIKN